MPPPVEKRDGGISTRAFVVVVLVVLMLLMVNLLVIIFYLEPFSRTRVDDGPIIEGHPYDIKVEAQVISEDTEWVGRTGRLDHPVRIDNGSTLRLVDCHLELHRDDVPWFEFPFFHVEERGTLEIVDSVLEAVPSTIPDDALVGPVPSDSLIPHISRSINLEGTTRPVLTFDLKWRFSGTPLSVAVQRDPTSALEVLERFDPQGPCEGWEHVEVSLDGYIGDLPRVVIYFSERPEDVYFIKDLNITDDGGELPFDPAFTEDLYRGGWVSEAFYEYSAVQRRSWEISRAIQCLGSVLLQGTIVRVPTELHRSGGGPLDREGFNRYYTSTNVMSSIRGMHIQIEGGSLEAKDSTFEGAAVLAIDSLVDLSDCQFESPYDMVTMYNCTGTLADDTFTRKGSTDGLVYSSSMKRALWAVSVQNNSNQGPVAIVDCDFIGVEQAIDLGYALYSIKGCSFLRVEEICIWEHVSPEPTAWDDLKARNSFLDCPGHLYMRTGRTDLFFSNDSVNHRNDTFIDTEGKRVEGINSYSWYHWSYWFLERGRLIRLDMLVESMTSIRIVNHTEVRVFANTPSYYWADTLVTVVVPAGVDTLHVNEHALVEENLGEPWDDVSTTAGVYKVWPAGDAKVGTYNMTVLINADGLVYVSNPSVDIYLDNEVVRHVGESGFWSALTSDPWVRLEMSHYLTPGVHDYRIVVSGYRYLNETIVNDTKEVFFDNTTRIMRAAPANTSEEIEAFVRGEGYVLAIDVNTNFELHDFQPANGSWFGLPTFFLTGGKGSGLTFRNLTFEPDLMASVGLFSHVDLHFVDTNMPGLNIVQVDDYLTYEELMENDLRSILGEIIIQNSTKGWIDLDVGQYSLKIIDSNGTSGVTFFCRGNSTVYMENVTEHFWSGWASGPIWSYTIKDCYFWGYNSSGLDLHIDDIRKSSIINTAFNGASLNIEAGSPYVGHWELDISGCQFIGDRSLLSMLWNTYRRSDWSERPSYYPPPYGSVTGNTFSGNGTSVVLHHTLYDSTFVNNTLADGVGAWAWYWTEFYPEPETDVDNDYEVFVFEDPDLLTECPEHVRLYFRDVNYFYEVTNQLGGPIEHPQLRVAILWYTERGYDLMLVDIVNVDLALDWSTITYPIWPDIQGLLPTVIDDWPWDLEEYDGARW